MMRRPVFALALLTLVVAVTSATAGGASGRLPGSTAFRTCAAAGPYWPTMTLAVNGSTGWVACKERSLVQKVDTRTGKVVRSVRLGAPVIAVATGFGSLWALEGFGTLVRIAPGSGRVVKRIELAAQAPYNIWIGAGSVWVVDDSAGTLLRIAPGPGRVTARIQVGDGPADLVFRGTTAWARAARHAHEPANSGRDTSGRRARAGGVPRRLALGHWTRHGPPEGGSGERGGG
jgi:hypothetical protein